MLEKNPYAATLAADKATPAEISDIHYSGFWQRVGAYLIDFVIVSPLLGIDYLFGGSTPMFPLYMLVPSQLLVYFLHLHMVVKYGATPGKLLLGLRIVKTDGAPVTLRDAALRYSVIWLLSTALSVIMIFTAMEFSKEAYSAFSYTERSMAIATAAPWMTDITTFLQIWVFGCLISILANKKRRALHDFIAKTVVIRKRKS